jgi:D-alanyl-D-alanine carboxypeptidase
MRRRWVAVVAGALVAVVALAGTAVVWSRHRASTSSVGPAPTAANRPPVDPVILQPLLDGVVRAGAPGAVAVMGSEQGTWQGASGLGDLGARRPARPGDRFRIASVTKSFVATVVLQLVGEGKLQLDDTVGRWLPGLVPNGQAITVRQLLNHTSGLYNWTDEWVKRFGGHPGRRAYQQIGACRLSDRALVARAVRHPPVFAPGTRFSYSNTNYLLAGLVIERVSGARLTDQLQQRIFGPLGLRDSELPASPRIAGPHLHGYGPPDQAWVASDGPAGLVDVTEASMSCGRADGAMVSTAADVASFYRALLGGRLLAPGLLRQMQTTVDASDMLGAGGGYGLGLMKLRDGCQGQLWGHFGEGIGYVAMAFTTSDGDRQLVAGGNLWPAPLDAVQTALRAMLSVGFSC